MVGERSATESDPGDRFSEEAARAGLTLPRPHRANPWEVAAVCSVILLVSLGIGVSTGWLNLRANADPLPGLLGPQSCVAQGGQKVDLPGSIAPNSEPQFAVSLGFLTDRFTSSDAGCVEINFTSGTGTPGPQGVVAGPVDFSMLEAAPTPAELSALPSPAVLLPTGLTSVSVVYNLPGVADSLRLNGSVLEGIFAGTIRSWDAPAVVQLNPSTNLPRGLPISVVHRSDPTALNGVFTTFLADTVSSWSTEAGVGDQVPWPTGVGVNGSGNMAAFVATTPGALGYMETGVSLPTNVSVARMENAARNFTSPDIGAVVAAAAAWDAGANRSVVNWSGDPLLEAPGLSSYPLVFPTYLLVYEDLGKAFGGNLSLRVAQWEMTYLWWVVTDGGYVSASLGVAGLPEGMVSSVQQGLEKIAFDGTSVLEGNEGSEGGETTGEF
ncbi:MAG TPA: substrate-binding domain-containing protein [Thermoplasmata archaeon]|nr:substrate-binding domain-containing protein [Thermoplasmata archaeon]